MKLRLAVCLLALTAAWPTSFLQGQTAETAPCVVGKQCAEGQPCAGEKQCAAGEQCAEGKHCSEGKPCCSLVTEAEPKLLRIALACEDQCDGETPKFAIRFAPFAGVTSALMPTSHPAGVCVSRCDTAEAAACCATQSTACCASQVAASSEGRSSVAEMLELAKENAKLSAKIETMEALAREREDFMETVVELMAENARLEAQVEMLSLQAELIGELAESREEMLEQFVELTTRAAKAEAIAEFQEKMLESYAKKETAETLRVSTAPSALPTGMIQPTPTNPNLYVPAPAPSSNNR